MDGQTAYGFWPLVVINSMIFIVFAFGFTKPKTARDWRSLGALSAFIVALFTEMYGFPLTIKLGFLLQWPTILTLAMFPVLVWMYLRLARREEAELQGARGEEYDRWAAVTPRVHPPMARLDPRNGLG